MSQPIPEAPTGALAQADLDNALDTAHGVQRTDPGPAFLERLRVLAVGTRDTTVASRARLLALAITDVAGLETALSAKQTAAQVDARIQAVIGAAPGALDTLDELAAALGDDANFAATVTTALAGKVAQAAYDADKAALATTLGTLEQAAGHGFDITTAIERSAYTDDAALQAAVEASQTARGYALVVGPSNP